jgi:hypothetical protein
MLGHFAIVCLEQQSLVVKVVTLKELLDLLAADIRMLAATNLEELELVHHLVFAAYLGNKAARATLD